MLCDEDDVKNRLRRDLTDDEEEYLGSMIEEAEVLVLSYLSCPPERFSESVPGPVRVVTSRMVARVIQEGEIAPEVFGATQHGITAGPFSQQATFTAGARTGGPWLTRVDKSALEPFRCGGKAFAIETVPQVGAVHAPECSANNYRGAKHWLAYCTCGADIAGKPIYGGSNVG